LLESQQATAAPEVDDLAEKILTYMVVEHEPHEYPRDVLQKVRARLPSLVKSYRACSPEQVDRLGRKVGEFLEYEESQYDDVCQWYAKLTEAVASKDTDSLALLKSAKIISERTRALASKLPSRIKKLAEDQMTGAEGGADAIWKAIPPGGSLTLSAIQAGQKAAAEFNGSRKQSYSNSYRQITGKDLFTR
jgi:hypothetical protein